VKIWADVYDASGTLQGEGPITNIVEATITRVLDGPGEIRLTLPAADNRVQDLIANERRVKIYAWQNETTREIGSGILRLVEGESSVSGVRLAISGPDQLDELRRANLWLAAIYDGDTISDVLSSVIAEASGWTLNKDNVPDENVYARFDGVSVLKALQEIAARYGLHLRLDGDKTVLFGDLGDQGSLRAVLAADRVPQAMLSNDAVGIIERIQWRDNSEDIVNRIVPLGGGQGEAALTLEHSTRGQDRVLLIGGYGSTNQDQNMTLQGPPPSGVKLAQGIQVASDQWLTSAQLYLRKTGNPTGTMTLRVETDNAGEPSGTLVHPNATATLAESGLIDSDYEMKRFTFAGGFYLDASTQYWLVLSTTRGYDGSNFVLWGADGTSPSYTGGNLYAYDGATWSDQSKDGCFELETTIDSRADESIAAYDASNRDSVVPLQRTGGYQQLAQSFVADGARVAGVNLWMSKHGSPAGNLTVQIQTDSGGSPSGTAVSNGDGTSGAVAASSLAAVTGKVTFTFTRPPWLDNGTTYWLVLQTTDSPSASDFVQWAVDSAAGYAGGAMQAHDGGSWSALGKDACFGVVAECVEEPYAIQTMTGPDGTTLYYLEDSASVGTYGAIERVVALDISPLSHSLADLANAANALYDAAAAWLERNATKQETYRVQLRKAHQTVKPGQKVRLTYQGMIEDANGNTVTWRDLDDEYWVTRVEETFGASGAMMVLELSVVDRVAADMASLVVGTIEQVELKNVQVQAYPAVFTYVYTDFVQNAVNLGGPGGTWTIGKRAQFHLPIGNTIMQISKVRLRVKTRPLYTLTRYDTISADPDMLNAFSVIEGYNYPANIRMYINGDDVSAQFGGPWKTGSLENSEWSAEFDITDVIIAAGVYGEHLIEFSSDQRTGTSTINDQVNVPGYTFQRTAEGSNGVVELTVEMHCTTQAVKVG